MVKQHPIKLLLLACMLLGVWWWWPSSELRETKSEGARAQRSLDQGALESGGGKRKSSTLISSIQPVSMADAAQTANARVVAGREQGSPASDAQTKEMRKQITQRFKKINQMVEDDEVGSAVDELKELIREFPTVTEPYINLAALYSKTKQLELARQTLNQGIAANPNTAMLFESRQTVLGVQAAQAYQQALNAPVTDTGSVLLPFISTIEVPASSSASASKLNNELTKLNSRLSSVQLERDQLEQAKLGLQEDKSRLEKANGKLELEKANLAQNGASLEQYKREFASEKSRLEQSKYSLEQDKKNLSKANQELEQKNKTLLDSNEALAAEKRALEESAQTLSAQAEALEKSNSDLVAKASALELARASLSKANASLRDDGRLAEDQRASNEAKSGEIERLKARLGASEQALKELRLAVAAKQKALDQSQTEVASLSEKLANDSVIASVGEEPEQRPQPDAKPKADAEPEDESKDNEPKLTANDSSAEQVQTVVDLVKSWAADWSAQNVSGYVSHYADNYTPPRGSLTHQQWLEQREIRLSNKTFINVDVSDFQGQRRGDKLVVTFSQHYRSNTVDDKIVKRLVFAKNGDDWSSARIVDEVVVSR